MNQLYRRINCIIGEPEICGINLPATINAIEDTFLEVSTTICGYPKPTVRWFVDDEIYKNNIGSTKQEIYQFTYKAYLTLSLDLCNKSISYHAFTPKTVIKQKSCIHFICK